MSRHISVPCAVQFNIDLHAINQLNCALPDVTVTFGLLDHFIQDSIREHVT